VFCFRRFSGPVLVLILLASTPAWADVSVNSSLDLTKLLITPSSGSLVIVSPVTASIFAQAQTNLTLPASVSFLPDTPSSFFAALDAELTGLSTPEPTSFALLPTALGLSALLGRRAWRGRLHRDTEPRP
jgi:hypothetical protein